MWNFLAIQNFFLPHTELFSPWSQRPSEHLHVSEIFSKIMQNSQFTHPFILFISHLIRQKNIGKISHSCKFRKVRHNSNNNQNIEKTLNLSFHIDLSPEAIDKESRGIRKGTVFDSSGLFVISIVCSKIVFYSLD